MVQGSGHVNFDILRVAYRRLIIDRSPQFLSEVASFV